MSKFFRNLLNVATPKSPPASSNAAKDRLKWMITDQHDRAENEAHNVTKSNENKLQENISNTVNISKAILNTQIDTPLPPILPPIVEKLENEPINTVQHIPPVEETKAPQINLIEDSPIVTTSNPSSTPVESISPEPVDESSSKNPPKVSNLRKLYGIGARYEQILNKKWEIYEISELRNISDAQTDVIKSEIPPIKKFKQRAAAYDESSSTKKQK